MATPSTSAVKSALSRLESIFVAALAHRNNAYAQYRASGSSGVASARLTVAIDDLRTQAQTAARSQAEAIDGLFTDLIAATQAHIAEVAQSATDTPAYRAYQQEVISLAPLVGLWSERV